MWAMRVAEVLQYFSIVCLIAGLIGFTVSRLIPKTSLLYFKLNRFNYVFEPEYKIIKILFNAFSSNNFEVVDRATIPEYFANFVTDKSIAFCTEDFIILHSDNILPIICPRLLWNNILAKKKVNENDLIMMRADESCTNFIHQFLWVVRLTMENRQNLEVRKNKVNNLLSKR